MLLDIQIEDSFKSLILLSNLHKKGRYLIIINLYPGFELI